MEIESALRTRSEKLYSLLGFLQLKSCWVHIPVDFVCKWECTGGSFIAKTRIDETTQLLILSKFNPSLPLELFWVGIQRIVE